MDSIPEKIIAIGKLMFDRRLSDVAGGNISARRGDFVYITPTQAGQKWLWELEPGQILCAPLAGDELLALPEHSKESISHLMVYRAFPEVGAIIHSHPFHLMPFYALGKAPTPLTLEAQIYGEMSFIAEAPMYSAEQGALIVEALAPKRELIAKKAAAVLMPRHGIFVAGSDLNAALDCLERMDASAWCNLAARLIG